MILGMIKQHCDIRKLRPHFGAEIRNVNLVETLVRSENEQAVEAAVQEIQDLLLEHRLLVFKDQGLIGGADHVSLSRKFGFGELKSTFSKHPQSPHPDVFRVSNDPSQGCTQVGRSGWHNDGTFEMKPFRIQTMHFHAVIEGGDTWFMPLSEFYHAQDEETKTRWNQLFMITKYGATHPLVYIHPSRNDETMLFHCGAPFVAGWAWNKSGAQPSTWAASPPTFLHGPQIQNELTTKLDQSMSDLGFCCKWQVGDFALIDNLAVAHYAVPGTQAQKKEGDLRILHRTTIEGSTVPESLDGIQSFHMQI